MTPDEISRQLGKYFSNNWTATPIAWPNVNFTAPDGSWVRFNVLPDNSDGAEIKGTGFRQGVVKVQIFTKTNIGSRTAQNLAGQVEQLFHYQDINGVYCELAYSGNPGLDETKSWYQITTTIPWWAWINE